MEELPTKKRKLSLSLPKLKPILYLNCKICNEKVYQFKPCQNNWIYCSYDCLSVLMLNNMNNQENTTYEVWGSPNSWVN